MPGGNLAYTDYDLTKDALRRTEAKLREVQWEWEQALEREAYLRSVVKALWEGKR